MTTRGMTGGCAPALGAALRARAGEVGDEIVSRWRGDASKDGHAAIESDIRRAALAGTRAVADFLATGETVGHDRWEEWDWTGEAPLSGRITLSALTKLYVHWRTACDRVLREEASACGAPGDVLRQSLDAVQLGADVGLVRMAKRFESTHQSREDQLSEHRERLEHQALHDPLTGLANRALLLDRIEHAIDSAGRRGARPAIVFLDLDFFKSINDASGHSAGDQLLLEVARRIQRVVRPDDTIARLGGDEFVVLCEDLDDPVSGGVSVAGRIAESFGAPFAVAGRDISAAASIGVAPVEVGDTAAQVLARADRAMYRAKQRGRGRVEVYNPSIDHLASRRAEIASALLHALSRAELNVVYQPVVTVRARRVVAREALLRWRHPSLGDVPPSEAVPLAQSAGAIDEIGGWVLDKACHDCAVWRSSGDRDVGIAVNVTGLQLSGDQLVFDVEKSLKMYDLPGNALTIDVTESQLTSGRVRASESLDRLRTLGVRIAIDDFGTGYSSMSWLERLPADVVKVDRSFVSAIGAPDGQSAMVEGMVKLAHTLGLWVVAKGVETEAQLARLAMVGCDAAQGFLLGHPAAMPDMG